MTFETYEKAQELRSKMDYISNLQCLIKNATSKGSALAAITDIRHTDALRIIVESCKVNNHSYLTEEFAKKFLEVLDEEYERTLEEFNKL